jgi:toxin ParE1/3/4
MLYTLTHAATIHIREIWQYTEQRWGSKQADKYTRGIVQHCKALSLKKLPLQPYLIHRTTTIYRSRYEKHLLFFKKTTDSKLSILAIFHTSMDIPQHLVKYIGE